jgi:FKBP12-rapamycin complex-associated protein
MVRSILSVSRVSVTYMHLLRVDKTGHEDLRQDERVMQLFGLVNTLLTADQEAAKRHLSIQQYSVTPLSPGAGLLGWVQHSDTMHMLIKGYRESRKILVDIEHRLMQQVRPAKSDQT